jgi:hypothetical protein
MTEAFHYSNELIELLVEAIARLFRSKKAVVLFLRGAGVSDQDLLEVNQILAANPGSITKFEIVRKTLTTLNLHGDSGLRPRREIIKRVVEFEHFETCWPEDQLKAKGLVASVREAVNAKDSFTRMKNEREAEREETLLRRRLDQQAANEFRTQVRAVASRLSALFGMNENPQERGRQLESVLNDMFRTYGVQVREAFRRQDPDTSKVLEQIDGVIELDGEVHVVEMKWLNDPVGVGEFFPHLARLFLRANARGIFIASSGYTGPVIAECATALSQKTMMLCSLQEIVMLLQRHGDLTEFLKRKSRAAIIDKNPFLEILS